MDRNGQDRTADRAYDREYADKRTDRDAATNHGAPLTAEDIDLVDRYRLTTDEERQRIEEDDRATDELQRMAEDHNGEHWRMLADGERRQQLADEHSEPCAEDCIDSLSDTVDELRRRLDLAGADSPIAPQPSAHDRLLSALANAANAAGELGMVDVHLKLAEMRADIM